MYRIRCNENSHRPSAATTWLSNNSACARDCLLPRLSLLCHVAWAIFAMGAHYIYFRNTHIRMYIHTLKCHLHVI